MKSLAGMDVDLLVALDALLTHRNVTHASERLGIGQPAMSARLLRLRSLLNDRLFVPAPNGRGVVPTPRAIALAPLVESVLKQIGAMLEPPAFDVANSDRTFTVALLDNPAVMLGPDLVGRVQAEAAGIRLRLMPPDKARMPELLERGEVDVFVGVEADADKSWRGRPLFEDSFVTAQRKGHPRGTGALDLDVFCALKHVLVSAEGNPFVGLVDHALTVLGRKRSVVLSIQSYAVAPTLVAESDLLCTLPMRFLRRFASSLDLFATPLSLPPFGISAFWHERSQEDQGHRWLRNQIFSAASGVQGR
jgi:DNA-binding transcriptional LysR family regulator